MVFIFGISFLHLFSFSVFRLWTVFIIGDWWVCRCVHMWQLSFQFCIFMFCIWNGSMMKPTWMLSRVGSLKKAPLSAEMLEKRCLMELNIVNNHHSKNNKLILFVLLLFYFWLKGLLVFHFVCRQLNCKLLSDCCSY